MSILAGETITPTLLASLTDPVASSGSVTPASSFSVTTFEAYDAGGNTTLTVALAYSGSTVTASSTGHISGGLNICTLPAAMFPPMQMYGAYVISGTSAGTLTVNTSGVVTLQTLYPSQSLASGQTVYFTITIPTG